MNQFEVNPSIKNAELVFFGDSRAEQWPIPEWYKSYSINLGIGQQTSAQAVLRFEKQEEYIHDCIVLIQIGVNDLKTIPLFPERKEEIVKNCIKNIEQLIRNLEHAGNKVIVSTIFPIGDVPLTRSLVWSNDVDTAVIEVNKSIHATKSESVMIFDAYSLLLGEQRKVKKKFSFEALRSF